MQISELLSKTIADAHARTCIYSMDHIHRMSRRPPELSKLLYYKNMVCTVQFKLALLFPLLNKSSYYTTPFKLLFVKFLLVLSFVVLLLFLFFFSSEYIHTFREGCRFLVYQIIRKLIKDFVMKITTGTYFICSPPYFHKNYGIITELFIRLGILKKSTLLDNWLFCVSNLVTYSKSCVEWTCWALSV